ncbi:aminotransferase class III-fold pyridoxal phosphate-dependent enzyme [Algoriphagus namhaensis]|uniref:Aminotransferase class III-fold pyridoxal phosphate-dependent enzyme n=1 Tax=Algoriphagus namhaensis TaxID=915353 RepID=A0ABV8AY51_9BACT
MKEKEIYDFLIEEFEAESSRLEKLDGYANMNFSFLALGEKYILKTYPFEEQLFQLLKAETEILVHLSGKANDSYPVAIPFKDGSLIQTKELDGNKTIFRVLSYLPGDFMGDAFPSQKLYGSLGKALAEMNLQLKKHTNLVIKGKQSPWDLQYFGLNKSLASLIPIPHDRKVVDYFFLQFEENIGSKLPNLRRQVIHGDANEWNILVEGDEVSAFIDFGDSCFSPLINEVAIALTYVIYDKENPLYWVSDFLKSYHQVFPLLVEELELLYYLIAARLCTSVCQSAKSKLANPENAYATVSEKSAWQTLHRWIRISPLHAEIKFKELLGFPISKSKDEEAALKDRHQFISPLLSVSYKKPLSLSGSAFQYMYDTHGNTILDAYNNIPHVGHCHPKVVQAGQRQMAKLNTNTRYLYDLLPRYAEKLLGKFPKHLNRVFFVNSGSAASDLAIRIAAAYSGNRNVMVMEHGYHGNTQISIDISDYKFSNKKGQGQASNILKSSIPDLYRGKYQNPETAGWSYAQEAIAQLKGFEKPIGAFVSEPIVGCGGQVPLAPGYLKALYPAIRAQGGICISDEVQTGFGRVGEYFWGYEAQEVIPDMVILGKPMGNGHPIGAVITTQEVAEAFEKGVEFFSSFGGNPVSCAIGISVLEVIEEEGLQQNALEVGEFYKKALNELKNDFSCIGDVRGSGLFLGVELVKPDSNDPDTALASLVKNELRNQNILISTDGPYDNVLKTKPPLCFSKSNADQVFDAITTILQKVEFHS